LLYKNNLVVKKQTKMDLGTSLEKTSSPMGEESGKSKKYYPSIHISGVKGLEDLPDGEFEFTGKGRVVSMTHNKKAGTCSCEIEVMDLEAGDKAESADLEDSLDKVLTDKEESKNSEMEEEDEMDYEDEDSAKGE
jgi:hypothetical protein